MMQRPTIQQWFSLGLAVGLWSAIALPAIANGRIISIQGAGASIRRQGGGSNSAYVGTVVRSGDVVVPRNGTTVTVQCRNANGTYTHGRRSRTFGLADVCPNFAPRNSQAGRGEDDFLLFLEQRFEYASQVREGNPALQWEAIPRATNYQVQMWDCGQAVYNCTEVIWETVIEGTTTAYMGPPLEPDRNYELTVIAKDVTESGEQFLMLRRLAEPQAETLAANLTQLNDMAELSDEAQALAKAEQLLAVAEPETLPPAGIGLVLEAIAALETVAPESETPYLHRLLGDLYLQGGRLTEAQQAYERVMALTPAGVNRGDLAAAQVGLANIAAAQGDLQKAELWLRQAQINYLLLADTERAEQVKDWLARLSALGS